MQNNIQRPDLYLINGPLGAGKTTFLRQLLNDDAFKKARVIENEFASVSVDTDQLHDHQAEVQTIAGVCICCSTGDELTDALRSLATTAEPVVIEATGVANSLKLIEKIVVADMLDHYTLRHAVFILDAAEAMGDIEGVLREYYHELKAADTVLISKTDLISAEKTRRLVEALYALGLRKVSFVQDGVFDTSLLLTDSNILTYFAQVDETLTNHDAESSFTIIDTNTLVIRPATLHKLCQHLVERFGVRRMKGNFIDHAGKTWHVEATPHQVRVSPYVSGGMQLVVIGTQARLVTNATIKELAV